MISLFEQHVLDWRDCKRCPLHETRKQVVFGRGELPCDILFIGEAPGYSENTLGYSFAGPAGHLMDRILRKAFAKHHNLSYYLTNLVGCIPLGEANRKTEEPNHSEILSCKPRLQEIVKIANPKLLVCVGKLATSWLDKLIPKRTIPAIDLVHPAAIIRSNYTIQGLQEQKQVLTLSQALDELEGI